MSSKLLDRKLHTLAPAGFVLGTEVPPEHFAAYDFPSAAQQLQVQHRGLREHAAKGQSAERADDADEAEYVVGTWNRNLMAPLELTLSALHMQLHADYPQAKCCRWQRWRLEMPASPRLPQEAGCSMGQRFLQHFVDWHEQA